MSFKQKVYTNNSSICIFSTVSKDESAQVESVVKIEPKIIQTKGDI